MRVCFECIHDLKMGASFEPFREGDLPQFSFKNSRLRYIHPYLTPYVERVISAMPFEHKHQRILVDVKVHHLKKGEYPAIPGWHIDGLQNILKASDDNLYHLFVSGQGCLTQFLPFSVERELDINMTPNYNVLFQGIEGTFIPSNTICTYRKAPHRASRAQFDETRLLIRAVETNYLRPRNRFFDVYYERAT